MNLWYKWNGEGCHNLRETEGLEVDIKGEGGFIVVPPSVRLSTQRPYQWTRGSCEDVKSLTILLPGALTPKSDRVEHLRFISKGHRNSTIFKLLLHEVKYCDDIDVLSDVAETLNDSKTAVPLPEN